MLTDDQENSGSIRDELVAAFKGSSEETSTPDTRPAEGEERQEAAPESTGEVSEEKTEKVSASPDKKGDDESPLEAPVRWPKEDKEEFSQLTRKAQEILLKRNKGIEQHLTREMTNMAQQKQRYNEIEKVLSSRREQFARQGLDDARALNMVMSYWDQAQSDPLGFIDQFARQRGLDLTQIYGPTTEQLMEYMGGGQSGSPDGQQAMNPLVQRQFAELQAQNQHLQQQLAQVGQTFQGWQQQQQQTVQNAARSEFDSFRSATNDQGEPLYPFFEELRGDMAQLMRSGYANTLAEAYDKAQRVRPDVWQKITESQDLARRRAEEKRIQEEAAKAKRAGASVSAGGSSVRAPAGGDEDSNLSLRELIQKQFAASRAGTRL